MLKERYQTLEQVERDGKWVSAHNTGHKARINRWRLSGRLKEGVDYKTIRVAQRNGFAKHRDILFYRRKVVEQLLRVNWREQVRSKVKAIRQLSESKIIHGEEFLRAGPAAAYLNVSKQTLNTIGGLAPIQVEVMGRETTYYPLKQLKAERENRAQINKFAANEVGLAEASRITGQSTGTLRNGRWCAANAIQYRKTKEHRAGTRSAVSYWFTRESLQAFASKPDIAPMPEGCLSVTQTAKRLRLSRGAVRNLCREGILKASRGPVPCRRHSAKLGWLIDKSSIEQVEQAMRGQPNAIRAGWALRSLKPLVKQPTTGMERLTLNEAAARLGVTHAAVWKWCEQKILVGKYGALGNQLGIKEGWLVTKASVDEVAQVLQQGLDRFKTAEALRALARNRGKKKASPVCLPEAESGEQAKRQKRGRRRSEATEIVMKFCYENYCKGLKLIQIVEMAARLFPSNPSIPKSESDVTNLAKRYARRHGLELSRPQETP